MSRVDQWVQNAEASSSCSDVNPWKSRVGHPLNCHPSLVRRAFTIQIDYPRLNSAAKLLTAHYGPTDKRMLQAYREALYFCRDKPVSKAIDISHAIFTLLPSIAFAGSSSLVSGWSPTETMAVDLVKLAIFLFLTEAPKRFSMLTW